MKYSKNENVHNIIQNLYVGFEHIPKSDNTVELDIEPVFAASGATFCTIAVAKTVMLITLKHIKRLIK